MDPRTVDLSAAAQDSFATFVKDEAFFALSFYLACNSNIEACAPIRQNHASFQLELNQLESSLDTSKPAYIVLRRGGSLTFITYVPYRAKDTVRDFLLHHRHDVVRQLGSSHISSSIICKEIAEITDARSWAERDAAATLIDDISIQGNNLESRTSAAHAEGARKDLGYRRNKCRLCDRRMKNRISPEALAALKVLQGPGAAVQISVDSTTETLQLNYIKNELYPKDVAATLPTDKPSFTFYRHPATHLLYFIFHSPDHATVQQRMKHTMAIPGLINVHAQDQDVHVDQKIEIHEPDDLVFVAKDERIGRFRSVYLRNGFDGTESTYDGLEGDKAFYDGIK
ncbi:uncharacterized protein J4E84_008169 [Alternaria hordeiaustralica]|uniref:uncharacterized protein n=1 Tax=Alternaria hordeiaustralica TaxID=1187925 RepID=UPI0020C22431|nr:uncharacterized protein J4E84_008169 [Alternaria hordeiaustralica]KAI4679647.1 hypothetical protein J4E84_008169 [Alternaria hordeiaustralica]